MTLFVTGGAGFIGSNFIFYWLGRHPDDRIVCLDKLTYAGNLSTLKLVMGKSNFVFVKGNICDKNLAFDLFKTERPEYVINFAAETHVDRSITSPEAFLQTNFMGTATLLEACREFGVGRYHQVSTDEVYGDLPLDRPDLFFTEDSQLRTSSPYSASKAAADLLVQSYVRTFGVPATISRCSNNYGPYQFPEKFIPLMIINAINDVPLPIYGDGLNVRDWLFVEDHCRAIELILQDGKDGEIYNVGGHNEWRNLEVVRIILEELNKPERLICFVNDRKGHDRRYAIDPGKIRDELGWVPEMGFEEGMKQTVRWYLDNREWWNEIVSGEYKEYYNQMYRAKS